MALTERIRTIVDRLRWQDQEFATKLGLSKATLSQRFAKSNWSIDEVISITELTGYSLYWLCQGLGPEKERDVIKAIDELALPMVHHHVLRYFLFSCRTGLRISDVTRLTWEHINEHNITMPMHKNRKRKKKMINMPITEERELLPEYNPKCKTIFDCYADAVTNRLLKDIARDAKIKKKITYHMSRHTFATTFLEGGGSVEVLQDLMDHEDITTTMIYSHMTDKRKREQKEKAFAKHPPQPLTD